jgi:hypothetical protein
MDSILTHTGAIAKESGFQGETRPTFLSPCDSKMSADELPTYRWFVLNTRLLPIEAPEIVKTAGGLDLRGPLRGPNKRMMGARYRHMAGGT